METLSISEDNHIEAKDKRRLFDKDSREVDIDDIILHDQDTKGLFQGKNGKLYYQDLEKSKLIQEYVLIVLSRFQVLRKEWSKYVPSLSLLKLQTQKHSRP